MEFIKVDLSEYPKNDLVIDTTALSKEEVREMLTFLKDTYCKGKGLSNTSERMVLSQYTETVPILCAIHRTSGRAYTNYSRLNYFKENNYTIADASIFMEEAYTQEIEL